MSPFSRFGIARLAALATVVVAPVLGSACVQDQDYLIVEKAIWFSDRDNCVLSGSEDTPLAMTVDVKFDTRIGMGFLVTNNLTENPASNTGIDDSVISMESADVSLSFTGGAVAGAQFEVQLPTNSIPGGESASYLIQIPSSVAESLRATMQNLPEGSFETLEMEVVFRGRRSGQSGKSKLGSVKTPGYIYPFEICYGCLESCTAADSCADPMDVCPTETEWEGACGFAQGVSIYNPACVAP